jgi:hypothetical protein
LTQASWNAEYARSTRSGETTVSGPPHRAEFGWQGVRALQDRERSAAWLLPCDDATVKRGCPTRRQEKVMKRFIAAAAIVAAHWQPAHSQTIVGSIPEEFQGDWCWQENTDGEQVFRPGACKPKAGSLSIDRTTSPILRFRQRVDERRNPQDADDLRRFRGKGNSDLRCPARATARQEDRTHRRADR